MKDRNFPGGIIILLSFLSIAVFSSAAFAQAQVQKPTQNQVQVQKPVQNQVQTQIQKPAQNQAQVQKPVQKPMQNQAQTPVQKPAQNQVQTQVQKPVQNAPGKTTQPQAPVVEELVFKKKITEPSSGLITGIGGGYFSAIGGMGSILKSSWGAKVFVYNNAIEGKALGIGFEGSYADLKDIDNRGGVTYIPAIGYVTLTWNIFGVIDMQPKFGLGLTTMLAKIDNGITIKSESSFDFTLSFGFAVLKTFLTHYVVGADYQYYYFFERDPSKAHAVNLFAGYKL